MARPERFQPEEARKNLPAGVATGTGLDTNRRGMSSISKRPCCRAVELTLTGQLGM